MVQPSDIRKKADRIYAEFLRACIEGYATNFFPRLVPCEKELGLDVAENRRLVTTLREAAKETVGFGYSIEWEQIRSRSFGHNTFPKRITFETRDDLLRYVGKSREFDRLSALVERVRSEFPELNSWVQSNAKTLLSAADDLDGLIAVLRHFVSVPRPNCFARELPLQVDTKFIERNEIILGQWFDRVLPSHAIRADETHFARRYGLRYDEPQVFTRCLDEESRRTLGFPCLALSVPLHSLANLPGEDLSVIVVENKVNLLTMPSLPRSVVFGGLGNGVTLLAHVTWLSKVSIRYWGDLDVEGFFILSRLRALFPRTQSVLMDESSLERLRSLAGKGNGRVCDPPPNLTASESAAFRMSVRENLRIEQERIPQTLVDTTFRGQ